MSFNWYHFKAKTPKKNTGKFHWHSIYKREDSANWILSGKGGGGGGAGGGGAAVYKVYGKFRFSGVYS